MGNHQSKGQYSVNQVQVNPFRQDSFFPSSTGLITFIAPSVLKLALASLTSCYASYPISLLCMACLLVAPRSFSSYECTEEEEERLDMSLRLFVLTVLLVGYLLLLILPPEQGIFPSNLQQKCQRPIQTCLAHQPSMRNG